MQLDIQTLSVVTVFVTALLGALLVFAGVQNRAVRAPMVWGAAYIVSAVGLALLTTHGAAPDWVSVNLANALERVRRFPIRVGFPNQANSVSPLL